MKKIYKLILSFVLALFIPFFKLSTACIALVGVECPDKYYSLYSFVQEGAWRGFLLILIVLLISWGVWYLIIEIIGYIFRKIKK